MLKNIYKFVSKEKLDLVCNSIEKAHGLPNECYIDEEYTKLERKLIQLKIEREALKKDKDQSSKKRREKLEEDIADLE